MNGIPQEILGEDQINPIDLIIQLLKFLEFNKTYIDNAIKGLNEGRVSLVKLISDVAVQYASKSNTVQQKLFIEEHHEFIRVIVGVILDKIRNRVIHHRSELINLAVHLKLNFDDNDTITSIIDKIKKKLPTTPYNLINEYPSVFKDLTAEYIESIKEMAIHGDLAIPYANRPPIQFIAEDEINLLRHLLSTISPKFKSFLEDVGGSRALYLLYNTFEENKNLQPSDFTDLMDFFINTSENAKAALDRMKTIRDLIKNTIESYTAIQITLIAGGASASVINAIKNLIETSNLDNKDVEVTLVDIAPSAFIGTMELLNNTLTDVNIAIDFSFFTSEMYEKFCSALKIDYNKDILKEETKKQLLEEEIEKRLGVNINEETPSIKFKFMPANMFKYMKRELEDPIETKIKGVGIVEAAGILDYVNERTIQGFITNLIKLSIRGTQRGQVIISNIYIAEHKEKDDLDAYKWPLMYSRSYDSLNILLKTIEGSLEPNIQIVYELKRLHKNIYTVAKIDVYRFDE